MRLPTITDEFRKNVATIALCVIAVSLCVIAFRLESVDNNISSIDNSLYMVKYHMAEIDKQLIFMKIK